MSSELTTTTVSKPSHSDPVSKSSTSSSSSSSTAPIPLGPNVTRTLPFLLTLWGLGAFTAGYALSRLMMYWNGIHETKEADLQRLELNRKILSFLRQPIASQDNLPIAIALCNNVQVRSLHDLYARETELKGHSSFSQLVCIVNNNNNNNQNNNNNNNNHNNNNDTNTPLTPTLIPQQAPLSPLPPAQQQPQTTMGVMMATNGTKGVSTPPNGPSPTPNVNNNNNNNNTASTTNNSKSTNTTTTPSSIIVPSPPLHDPIILAQLRDALNEVNYQRGCLEGGYLNLDQVSEVILQVCEHYSMFVKLLNLPPLPPTPTINIYQNLATRFEQFRVPVGPLVQLQQQQQQYYHRFQSTQQQQLSFQPSLFQNSLVSVNDVQDLVELVLLEITLGPNVITMY